MEPHEPHQTPYGLDPLEPAGEALSFPKKALLIFIRPGQAFDAIRSKPDVLLPYVMSMMAAALFALLTMSLMSEYTLETMIESYKNMGLELPADQLQGFLRATMITTVVALIFGSFIAPFVKGAFSHLISMAFNGKATFKQSLSVVAYAYLIVVLGTLIRIPIALATGNYLFSFSPALLLGSTSPTDPLYGLLSAFDLFTLWYLGVSVLGFKKVHGLETWKAAAVVLLPFAMSLFTALLPVLTGNPL